MLMTSKAGTLQAENMWPAQKYKRRAEECNNNDTVDLRTILKVPCYIHGASILQSHNADSME
jgi:hypothetical protein